MTFLRFALVVLLLGPSLARAQQAVTATGSAIMGSGMTMAQTERLALDDARRSALQRFGGFVESEKILEDGNLDKRTRVTTASIVKTKDKKVRKQSVGETIRFVVTATFEIKSVEQRDTTTVARTVNGTPQPLAADRPIRSTSFDTKSRERARDRRRARHVAFAVKNAYPLDLVEVEPTAMETLHRERRTVVETSYSISQRDMGRTAAVGDTLKALSEKSVRMPFAVALVGMDAVGRVTFVKSTLRTLSLNLSGYPVGSPPRPGISRSKAVEQSREVRSYDFKATVPSGTKSLALVITRFESSGKLRTYMRSGGFRVSSDAEPEARVYTPPKGSRPPLDSLRLTREAFRKRICDNISASFYCSYDR